MHLVSLDCITAALGRASRHSREALMMERTGSATLRLKKKENARAAALAPLRLEKLLRFVPFVSFHRVSENYLELMMLSGGK